MEIGVIGIGPRGRKTAATLASMGHHVIAAETPTRWASAPSHSNLSVEIPGIPGALLWSPAAAIEGATVAFVCLEPSVAESDRLEGYPELAETLRFIVEHATGAITIALRSPTVLGVSVRAREVLDRARGAHQIEIAYVPDLPKSEAMPVDPARTQTVVGADEYTARQAMRVLFAPVTGRGHRLIETNLHTAEIATAAQAAFAALKVSYANSLARLAERGRFHLDTVLEVLRSDPRVGPGLEVNLGFRGDRLSEGVEGLMRVAEESGADFGLLGEAVRVNAAAVEAAFHQVRGVLWHLEGKRVALLGVGMEVDSELAEDLPALTLAAKLADQGAEVVGWVPVGGLTGTLRTGIRLEDDLYRALEGAQCAVACACSDALAMLDLGRAKDTMRYPVVIDPCNQFDPAKLEAAGFTYARSGDPPRGPS